MTTPIISITNLSKKYKLFNSKTDRIKEALLPFKKQYYRDFFALKDINLKVEKGKTIGIIGKNGSGKSTLLQLICSILKPTSGSIQVVGKISALLELGGGFNLDFTGRENVQWMGILMGFHPKAIEEKMGAIEEFAELGDFFDQPVKKYSTGMFLRLGFASAINFDPDILIIDEALSVGDAKFQHKCYQKFRSFQEQGKTMLLVSHDSNLILKHCDQAILLDQGYLLENGRPNDVVNKYLDLLEGRSEKPSPLKVKEEPNKDQSSCKTNNQLKMFLTAPFQPNICTNKNSYNANEYRQSSGKAEIFDYLVTCESKEDPTTIISGQVVDIYLKIFYHQPIETPHFGFSIKTTEGLVLYGYNTIFTHSHFSPAKESEIRIFKFSQKLNLHEGDYFIDLGIDEETGFESTQSLDRRCGIIHLSVLQKKVFDGIIDLSTSHEEILFHS